MYLEVDGIVEESSPSDTGEEVINVYTVELILNETRLVFLEK
jgi:hypothetical protein